MSHLGTGLKYSLCKPNNTKDRRLRLRRQRLKQAYLINCYSIYQYYLNYAIISQRHMHHKQTQCMSEYDKVTEQLESLDTSTLINSLYNSFGLDQNENVDAEALHMKLMENYGLDKLPSADINVDEELALLDRLLKERYMKECLAGNSCPLKINFKNTAQCQDEYSKVIEEINNTPSDELLTNLNSTLDSESNNIYEDKDVDALIEELRVDLGSDELPELQDFEIKGELNELESLLENNYIDECLG